MNTETIFRFFIAILLSAQVAGAGFLSQPSPGFCLDVRDGERMVVVGNGDAIAISGRWNDASATVKEDGSVVASVQRGEEASFSWVPSHAGHVILQHESGPENLESEMLVLERNVDIHDSVLAADEIWHADKVHLVTAAAIVPKGVSLLIEPRAVVKFMPGTSLVVETGGSCTAIGVVFTHVNDDAMEGDTLFDGETVPVQDDYKIVGNVIDDDTTEYRYMAPQELTSNITSNICLRGHRVYVVSNDVTVANGVTLTIQPGAILKFVSGKSLTVNNGGTLNAQGTRALPIVFTSLKDDTVGGDTNGDGDATKAIGGDWRAVFVKGRANMRYCEFYYGAPSNETGILETSGSGSLDMECCVVGHAKYDGIWNWGGTISVKNTVIVDTGWASAPYRGSKNEYINCIFYGNDVGMCYWSNWNGAPVYRNCVFAECSKGWCELGAGSYGDPSSRFTTANCLFWNPVGLSAQSCGLVGRNDNIWGNPHFIDPNNGDFRLQADSPCVDAGDGAVAPAKDYYNQPRQTIQGAAQTGTPDANGAYADIGIYEVQPRYAGADVDLEVKSVTAPETMTVGELVTISWREANVGSVDTDGKWYDKVEIVSANGAVVTLGTVPVAGIAAGGEKTITESSFRVPAVAEGACAIRVTANYQRDVYEGSFTANNVCLSRDATVSIPEVDFAGDEVSRIKLVSGQQVAYRLAGLTSTGGSLLIHSASGETFGAYVAFGAMPTTYASDSSFAVLPNGDVLVSIPPHSGDEAAYLMLDSRDKVQNGALDVTVSDAYPAIYALSKESMPNTGNQSLTIYGVGMDEVSSVALVAADGTILNGTSLRAANACELSSSFSLTGAKTGAYRVAVTAKDGTEASSSAVVSVIPHANAKAHLDISLDAPSAIRQNRWYEAVVTVKNTGDADAAVPIVVVNGDGLLFMDPDGGAELYENIIHVLAIADAGNPLVLGPDEQTVIHLSFKAVDNRSDRDIFYKILEPHDADWGSLVSQGDMDNATWASYLAEYKAGYADVSEFLDAVFAKALTIANDNFSPCNAFRLYDLIQKEKGGELYGVVSGVVFDDNRQPVEGISVGACAAVDDIIVYGSTDVNGMFTVYGVPTGVLAFVSERVDLKPDHIYELDSAVLSGVTLTASHIIQTEEPVESDFLHYDNFTLLPLSPQCACWTTDGSLKVGNLLEGSTPQTIMENGSFSSLRVERLDNNECVVSGIVTEGVSNRVFVCALRVSDTDIEIGCIDFIDDNVDGIASMYREGSTIRLIIHKSIDGEFKGWCVVDITKKVQYGEPTRFSQKSVSARMRATEMNFDIPNHPALSVCGLNVKGIGLGVGGRIDMHTSGVKENGCCKWVRSYNQKATGSLTASIAKKGGALKGSISEKADESYYCARKFSEENDCKEEHKTLVASKKTKEWRVQLEYTHSFLSTSDIVNSGHIQGTGYEWLANSPISLDVNGTITGTIGGDSTIVTRNYPQMASYYERTDTFGVELAGKLSIAAGLKWDLLQKQEHRNWQQNRDWSVDTGLSLAGQGTFSMSLQASRHSFGGETYWDDALGVVTLEARCQAVHVTGKLINDMGTYRWKYDIDLLFWGKTDEGDVFNSRRFLQRAQKENNVLLEDDISSDGITLQSWDFHQIGPDEYIYCREYIDDNRIRSGLFYLSNRSHDDIMISELSEDVVHIKPMKFKSGKIAVLSLCCKPDFSAGAQELLASYSDRQLYCHWYENGNWEQSVQVFDDKLYCDLNFDCACDGDIGTIVCSRKMRDNGNAETIISGCIVAGSNRAFDCVKTLYSNSKEEVQLVGASSSVLNGIPVISIVMNFGSDDHIYNFTFDSSRRDWNGDELVFGTRDIVKSDQAEVPEFNGKYGVLKSGGSDGCKKGCFCHCVPDDPKPGRGCGCKTNCTKCKLDCGTSCRCGDHSHFKQPTSYDPNEMVGPAGVGEERYVKPGEPMDYTIYFENQTNATAAAQDVYVTLPKDAGLDWSTFTLGEVVFGDNIDTALSGLYEGESNYALPGTNWSVRTTVEHTADAVKWHLRVIDPTTPNNYPSDAYAGFLPPNDPETHCGEGHVRFSVKVKDDAATGSVIRASASIVFDDNPAIETDPAWFNTVATIYEPVVDLGDGTTTNIVLVVGQKYGELPTPAERDGFAFAGWFTGPEGSGRSVTAESIVEEGDNAIYAEWTPLAVPLPVHRFYSKAYKGHFFTISEEEKDDLVEHNPNWKYEGTAYRAYTNEAAGTTKLYRFYSKGYRGHFFTIDAEEAETVKLNRNWKYEGIAYYVYPEEVEGSVPVFRFWSKGYRHHFYTTNEAEKEDIEANNPNWKYEGIAFYALPAEETGQGRAVASGAPEGGASGGRAQPETDGGASEGGAFGERALPDAGDAEGGASGGRALPEVIRGAGVFPMGAWTVEVREEAPDAEELAADPDERPAPLALPTLRVALPEGTAAVLPWSSRSGQMPSRGPADGEFEFTPGSVGEWTWLRALDETGEAVLSLWIRLLP